ncbi:MAG TPA: CAP domain-containing protein [Polyangiaceae bacterium]
MRALLSVVFVGLLGACSSDDSSVGPWNDTDAGSDAAAAKDATSLPDATPIVPDAKADQVVPPVVDSGPPSSILQQHCVDKINTYRATLSLPALVRDASKEVCCDGEAKTDALASKPHSAFGSCSEYAQNECPGYPSGDVSASLDQCLAQMWAEGPGVDFNTHGHYINMTSTSYTHVFCGFYTVGDGTFWGAQDFY